MNGNVELRLKSGFAEALRPRRRVGSFALVESCGRPRSSTSGARRCRCRSRAEGTAAAEGAASSVERRSSMTGRSRGESIWQPSAAQRSNYRLNELALDQQSLVDTTLREKSLGPIDPQLHG